MLYIITFSMGWTLGFLFNYLCSLVDKFEKELHTLSSRELRDLYYGVIQCCASGLRKKTFCVRVYLICIKLELTKRGEKI